MSVSKQIQKKIKGFKRGKPFKSASFLELGSRASVDQALWRLVKKGEITRIKNGVFVKPEKNPYVGEVLPEPVEIARFHARESGNKVGINGAEAARRLGFSTQMPSRALFLTNGPSKKYRLGNLEVIMKHVAPRKVALAERPAGEALSALWYLGKNQVNAETFEVIESKLPDSEFAVLVENRNIMPGWMREALNVYTKEHQVV